jgi:protein phosphatase
MGTDGADESVWHLLAVADGVGGLAHGEWASETALAILKAEVRTALGTAEPVDALSAGFRAANARVWGGSSTPAGWPRAATTLVAAVLGKGAVWWAHVGDSRAYLVRQGRAQRLTQDHSWVEEQVRAGIMTAEEAQVSERRSLITRSVGGAVDIDVETGGPIHLSTGDSVILCSDGLHGQVSDDELALITQQLLPEAAAERLVSLSNERGGPDNISVIVCAMLDSSATRPQAPLEVPNRARS